MKIKQPNRLPAGVIILLSTLVCSILFLAEQYWRLSYFITTPLKIALFLVMVIGYRRWIAVTGRRRTGALLHLRGVSILKGLIIGLGSAGVIIATYLLLRQGLDLDGIAKDLIEKSKVTPMNFIFIGLYITLGNSLLEEYFFRGFVYFSLHDLGFKRTALVFSATLFAAYHLAIFSTWFSLGYMALALVGLELIGLVYAWINFKSRSIVNSWIAHALADSAIIAIGLKMFGFINF